MVSRDHDTWLGRRIEQYQILALIGTGGMGVVYRARDTKLARDVALKVLPPEFTNDAESLLRSEREARLLASLNHANIAAIFDLKDWQGNRCLILEYVEGETLAERLTRGSLPVTEAFGVCLQIAQGLHAAHSSGVVHRDIKPANIKITSGGRVKILDFGLAKTFAPEIGAFDLSDAPTMLTQALPGTIRGTPAYMSPASEHSIRSLAILPFENAGGNPEMEYLSDGLTESIILSLSKFSQLRVMARSTVFRYKGRNDDAQQIGRELCVGAVLTGRVQQRGGTLLISAEMIDVENGWQLWGEQYRKTTEDIFAIEQDIAREISEKLRLKLTPEKEQLLSKRYTENVTAYHLYLKGKFHWGKRTAVGLQRSIQYFREAIEGDPTYALAYAGLAEGYVPLGIYCHVAPKDAFPKARAAAEKALEIDPYLVEASAVLAAIKGYFEWDLKSALEQARAVVERSPKYPRARQVLSDSLLMQGQFRESIQEVKRGLDLDPLSLHMNAAVAMMCYHAREYDESIEQARRTVELDPGFFPGQFYLGLAYAECGRYREAIEALQEATALSRNSTLMLAALGGAFASSGEADQGRRILGELEELRQHTYVSGVFEAAIYAGIGENDRAFACLEQAYQDRCSWLLRCLVTDPRLDKLRDDSRFRNLMRRVGISQ